MPPDPRETPDFDVETLQNPRLYSGDQVRLACLVAYQLDRGRFVLTIPPDEQAPRR